MFALGVFSLPRKCRGVLFLTRAVLRFVNMKTRRGKLWTQVVNSELVKLCLSFCFCLFPPHPVFRSRKPTSVMRCMCPLYDPNRQLWIELAPMSIPRINHGVLSAGKGELCICKVNIMKTYQCLKIWDTAYNDIFSFKTDCTGVISCFPFVCPKHYLILWKSLSSECL